jgi:hypothetical protein
MTEAQAIRMLFQCVAESSGPLPIAMTQLLQRGFVQNDLDTFIQFADNIATGKHHTANKTQVKRVRAAVHKPASVSPDCLFKAWESMCINFPTVREMIAHVAEASPPVASDTQCSARLSAIETQSQARPTARRSPTPRRALNISRNPDDAQLQAVYTSGAFHYSRESTEQEIKEAFRKEVLNSEEMREILANASRALYDNAPLKACACCSEIIPPTEKAFDDKELCSKLKDLFRVTHKPAADAPKAKHDAFRHEMQIATVWTPGDPDDATNDEWYHLYPGAVRKTRNGKYFLTLCIRCYYPLAKNQGTSQPKLPSFNLLVCDVRRQPLNVVGALLEYECTTAEEAVMALVRPYRALVECRPCGKFKDASYHTKGHMYHCPHDALSAFTESFKGQLPRVDPLMTVAFKDSFAGAERKERA